MNVNIEELITINYELEGLLYLALHRGEDTPVQVWEMISDKIDALREGVKMPEEQEEAPVSSAPDDAEKESDEYAVEPEETVTVHIIEEPAIQQCEEDLTLTDEYNIENDAEADSATCIDSNPGTIVEEAPEIEAKPEKEVHENTTTEASDTPTTVAEEALEVIEEVNEVTEEAPADNEPIRLDEKLARQYSRDLRKAFSLNDRFRFRRELFGNSDAEMNDTLNLVEAMLNREEACDYFYHDLQWDRDNPEVIDFMAIIDKHFSNK